MAFVGNGTEKRRKHSSLPVLAWKVGWVSRSTQILMEAEIVDLIDGLKRLPLLERKEDAIFQSMCNTKRALKGSSPSF